MNGLKAAHCYVPVVLQFSTEEYRECEGKGALAASSLAPFLCTSETIPTSQDKGEKHTVFIVRVFYRAEPK